MITVYKSTDCLNQHFPGNIYVGNFRSGKTLSSLCMILFEATPVTFAGSIYNLRRVNAEDQSTLHKDTFRTDHICDGGIISLDVSDRAFHICNHFLKQRDFRCCCHSQTGVIMTQKLVCREKREHFSKLNSLL